MWNGSVAMQALDWDVSANISCLQCGSSTKTGILVFFFYLPRCSKKEIFFLAKEQVQSTFKDRGTLL